MDSNGGRRGFCWWSLLVFSWTVVLCGLMLSVFVPAGLELFCLADLLFGVKVGAGEADGAGRCAYTVTDAVDVVAVTVVRSPAVPGIRGASALIVPDVEPERDLGVEVGRGEDVSPTKPEDGELVEKAKSDVGLPGVETAVDVLVLRLLAVVPEGIFLMVLAPVLAALEILGVLEVLVFVGVLSNASRPVKLNRLL